jgi:glycosyltransferase involved in cell wall biosynthesis
VREGRKRILLVKAILPYPPDQGTRVVSFDLIRTLQREFDVTVLARLIDRSEASQAAELERYCSRVVTVMAPNRRSWAHRIAYKAWYALVSVLRRRSMKRLYECPGAFVKAARRLAVEDFDCVVLEYWQLSSLIPVFGRRRTVLLTHDVEMLVNRQSALIERRLFHKLVKVRRWLLERREEIAAYREAARVLALTERDAAAVRKIRAGRLDRAAGAAGDAPGDEGGLSAGVGVLPVGVKAGRHRGGETVPERDPREVLFMGELRASFNQDALDFFVRRVYPHLGDVEGLRVTVVGGELPRDLAFFGREPRVEVTGRVRDVGPYLSRAACLVVPLRFGGGLRIRILEAMMAGLPVVCTKVAIAGMPFAPERDYLSADDPADIAGQIKRLLDDPALGAQIARNATEVVERQYNPELQSERTLQLFRYLSSRTI